jgi:hypothetical protein
MALTTKEIADDLGTDSKTLRKFLRSHLPKEDQPGQGGRYAFEKKDLPGLKKAWLKWSESKTDRAEPADAEAKDKKAKSRKGKKAAAPAEVIEDEGDDEPTAEDLSELDDEDVADIDDLLAEDDE